MTKSVFILALGLILATLYSFFGDLITGNFSSLLKINRPNQSESFGVSNFGDNLAQVDWKKPIQIRFGDESNPQNDSVDINQGTFDSSDDIIKIVNKNETDSTVAEIPIIVEESSTPQSVITEQIFPVKPKTQSEELSLVVNAVEEKIETTKQKTTIEVEKIEQKSNEQAPEPLEKNDSPPVENKIEKSFDENIKEIVVISQETTPKIIIEKKQVEEEKVEANNITDSQYVEILKKMIEMTQKVKSYIILMQEITQRLKQMAVAEKNVKTAENVESLETAETTETTETTENVETVEIAENVEIAKKVVALEESKTEDNAQTNELIVVQQDSALKPTTNSPIISGNSTEVDIPTEQIQAIIQTIISTRELLESLPKETKIIPFNEESEFTSNVSAESESTAEVTVDTPMDEKLINITQAVENQNQIPNNSNQMADSDQTPSDESLLVKSEKGDIKNEQIIDFSFGILDYAIDLSKKGEDEKALKLMLQIEPTLSDSLKYLTSMVDLQKKLGNTGDVIIYLQKAAEVSTNEGNYTQFQEVVGDMMQIDIFLAGDLIKRYSSRFSFTNSK